jgi:hypothetical protein
LNLNSRPASPTSVFATSPVALSEQLDTDQEELTGRAANLMARSTFSATDIVAHISLPNVKSYKLGTLALLSISSHRDKFPVSTLGRVAPKGFTYGHRTIGGTMVFSTIDRSVWHNLLGIMQANRRKHFPQDLYRSHPDDLPPFDVTLSFVNEWGRVSFAGIQGCTILDEGESFSLEQVEINETYSYMALDKVPMQPLWPDTSPAKQVPAKPSPTSDFGAGTPLQYAGDTPQYA